jgi:gamma-glutamyltranspeptidase/glutathione hydrolase
MNQSMTGTEAMVVSPHFLASAAGARILAKGGNAFDAAVAVSACLAVVYPHMTGLGGDSFWLLYPKEEQSVRAYNGSGRSGYAVTRERFSDVDAIPERGVRSVITVPGMVDSWEAVQKRYGRLKLEDVLEPAIAYAEHGFPCSKSQSSYTKEHSALLESMGTSGRIFLPHGRAPEPGERFVQKQLANSLKTIAREGRDTFYKGKLAKEMVTALRSQGGLLTLDDFAEHHGDWVKPLSVTYRDYEVFQVPPNSQGFVGLMVLNMLENYDFNQLEHGSFEYYHLMIETIKLAFKDRDQVLTDPDFHDIPLERLLSKGYARQLLQQISMNRVLQTEARTIGGDTAYAAVIDGEGNGVSFIQSLYFEFGSAVVAGDTGILMQNRGSFFSLDPQHVNRLEPRKRTFHTLMPAMACLDGKPAILYGTMGGEGQPQTQTAILTRMVDYGMDPQQAVTLPRWLWGRTWGEERRDLRLEAGMDSHVIEALSKVGHPVQVVDHLNAVMGHAHAIKIENGWIQGGVDPRSDGGAFGW